MFGNYLKIAWRNLIKQKLYSLINVFGLAVGLAFCILIFLFIQDELTFDRFHQNHEQIFRVSHPSYDEDGNYSGVYPYQPVPLGPTLKSEIPEVEEYIRFYESPHIVSSNSGLFQEKILFADTSIFSIFTFPLLHGTASTALKDLNSIVLSEGAANKYFGRQDPVGERLRIRLTDRFEDFFVTAVARPIPVNSSIKFDLMVPIGKLSPATGWNENEWRRVQAITYVRLAQGAVRTDVEKSLIPFRHLHYPWEIAEEKEGHPPVRFMLEPIAENHFNTWTIGGLIPASDPMYSLMLGGIALLVLIIACINFMTLAIGRSAGRTREVAVRKVVGASRKQLMGQFWGETMLLVILAALIGIFLADFFLPFFNIVAEKELHLDLFDNAIFLPALIVLMLLTGLTAGSYPALLLSGFKPVEIFRNTFRFGGTNALTRILVVLQFALAILLINGSIVILKQLDHMQLTNPGFNKEQVLVIPSAEMGSIFNRSTDSINILKVYRNELSGLNNIIGITAISRPPVMQLSSSSIQRHLAAGYHRNIALDPVDSEFMGVLDLKMVEGRGFDSESTADRINAVIINETMARQAGWTEPVGMELQGLEIHPLLDSIANPIVIGVVRDYHTRPLHFPVQPVILTLNDRLNSQINKRHLLIRIAPNDVPATLGALNAQWQLIAPEIPFTYSFLDNDLERQYRSEARWGKIVSYSAVFAIIIACLGLIGLVTLAVSGRTREFGIRKVLGASVTNISLLICKDYLQMTLLAVFLAVPVSYFAMNLWLQQYAYRIKLDIGLILLPCAIAVVAGILTISYQAVKSALVNPVDSLKNE